MGNDITVNIYSRQCGYRNGLQPYARGMDTGMTSGLIPENVQREKVTGCPGSFLHILQRQQPPFLQPPAMSSGFPGAADAK